MCAQIARLCQKFQICNALGLEFVTLNWFGVARVFAVLLKILPWLRSPTSSIVFVTCCAKKCRVHKEGRNLATNSCFKWHSFERQLFQLKRNFGGFGWRFCGWLWKASGNPRVVICIQKMFWARAFSLSRVLRVLRSHTNPPVYKLRDYLPGRSTLRCVFFFCFWKCFYRFLFILPNLPKTFWLTSLAK